MKKYILFLLILFNITCVKSQVNTFHYGVDENQNYDFYNSEGDTCVLLIHGGGWTTGDKSDFKYSPLVFKNNGYKVANMNYQYADGLVNWKHINRDVESVINDIQKRFNCNNFILLGGSAGATIAVNYCRTKDIRVKLVIALNGCYDFRYCWNSDLTINVAAYTAGQIKQSSPFLDSTTIFPPIAFIHGLNDNIFCSSQSIAMRNKIKQQGVKTWLLISDKYEHYLTSESIECLFQIICLQLNQYKK